MLRTATYILACLFLAMLIACGGAATSTVQQPSRAKPAAKAATPAQEQPTDVAAAPSPERSIPIPKSAPLAAPAKSDTIEERIAKLHEDQQRFARAAIAGNVPILSPAQMSVGDWGMLDEAEVFQVVNSSTILARAGGELFFLTGFDTSNMVDGKNYSIGEAFLVEGTRRYTTALGSTKQVLSLRMISSSAADSIVRDANEAMFERSQKVARAQVAEQRAAKEREVAEKAAQEVARKEADAASRRRTWNSADGQFSVEADFVSFGLGKVKLRRADNGKELTLELDTLSPADAAWIRSRAAGK